MEKIEPYWHKNKKWYYFDLKNNKFRLTNKAPIKAIESYKEYFKKDKLKEQVKKQ